MTVTAQRAGAHGLLMVSDLDLLDGVLRLAAAAGRELRRVIDPVEARRHWLAAPSVVLDADAARACAAALLPRRDRVVVAVHGGEPPPQVWQEAVQIGAAHVVSLPEAEAWLVAWLADGGGDVAQHGGGTVALVGGRGGAGASVLATAVAIAAVRDGRSTLLVDCDPLGGGLDLALGAEDVAGLRWPGVDVGAGRVPVDALHAALPAPVVTAGRTAAGGSLALLSCDRSAHGPTAESVTTVVEAGRRAGETVVCDLPRYPTDAALAALSAADLTVLVVPADVRGGAAAERVAAVLAEHAGPVGLVVRGPAPGGVAAEDVARALDLPLLAAMRPEPDLARDLESGHPPGRARGPLGEAALRVLAELDRVTGRVAA
jgi:secretion/DNA translocation related CpaE-like protein